MCGRKLSDLFDMERCFVRGWNIAWPSASTHRWSAKAKHRRITLSQEQFDCERVNHTNGSGRLISLLSFTYVEGLT